MPKLIVVQFNTYVEHLMSNTILKLGYDQSIMIMHVSNMSMINTTLVYQSKITALNQFHHSIQYNMDQNIRSLYDSFLLCCYQLLYNVLCNCTFNYFNQKFF